MPLEVNALVAQRKLLAGEALVDLPNLKFISVSGEDRLAWLHSLLSANIKNLQPNSAVEALALDANGHIEAMLFVTDDGSTSQIMVDESKFEQVSGWLRKMVFRSKVKVAETPAEPAVVASWGEPISAAAFSIADAWPQTAPGGHRYGDAPTEPWLLHYNAVTPDDRAELLASPNVTWAPIEALDALRIAAHRPWQAEVDERSIPHELNLLATAVHLSKGCYRGQETVAKVHNLGHPPRRLVLLHLDGSNHLLPELGDAVWLGDKQVGHVSSAANHHEMGPVALAVVSRATDIDAALEVKGEHEDIAATQEVVVPQDAGKVANLPRPSMLGKPRR